MLAPVPPKRKDGGSSFATLDRYIKEEVDLQTGEVLSRGEVMTSDAILSPETAAAEMKAVAAQNTRCKDPVMHVVLSWDKADHPEPEQWKQSVNYVMKSLGMKDHQYTAVAHDDTENYHVHVMANKIHPETYRSHTPAWMHKTLDKALRELEHKHQWTPANGLYRWDDKLGKAVKTTREERQALQPEGEELATGKAAKMEIYSGFASLETYCKQEPAKALDALMKKDGSQWADIHKAMAGFGLVINKGKAGGYSVSTSGDDGRQVTVKASKVFRKYFAGKAQRTATDKKLGEWQEPKTLAAKNSDVQEQKTGTVTPDKKKHYPRRSRGRTAAVRAERGRRTEARKVEYRQYRTDFYKHKKSIEADAKKDDLGKLKAITRVAGELRKEIKAIQSPAIRRAMRASVTDAINKERRQVKKDAQARRKAARPPTFGAWMKAQGVKLDNDQQAPKPNPRADVMKAVGDAQLKAFEAKQEQERTQQRQDASAPAFNPATVEREWKSEQARQFVRVQQKAARLMGKTRAALDKQTARRQMHEQQRPMAPRGLLAAFKQAEHANKSEVWGNIADALAKRWQQLDRRNKHVTEHTRRSDIPGYPSKGEQLAERWARADNPTLAKAIEEIRQKKIDERWQKMQERRAGRSVEGLTKEQIKEAIKAKLQADRDNRKGLSR